MSNDAQQQQDGLPEGTELPAAAQPAPAPGTTDRRGFLQTLAGIGLVAGAELVLPETTAKAEPIRSGSGRKPEEKQEVQKDPRPIVRAMQCFPKAEPPYFTSKTIEGRLIGELDTNNFSKEELAEIMKMKPRVDGYIAVMIDTNDKEHGGEVIAWMLETEKKAEEKATCACRQKCGVRCGDAYVGTYTPEYTRQPQFTLIQNIDIDVQVEAAPQQPWFPQYCTCGNGRTYAINGYSGYGNGYPGLYSYNCPQTHQRRYFCHNNQASRYRRLFGGGSFSSFGN